MNDLAPCGDGPGLGCKVAYRLVMPEDHPPIHPESGKEAYFDGIEELEPGETFFIPVSD